MSTVSGLSTATEVLRILEKSVLAKALHNGLNHWQSFCLLLPNGSEDFDNNASERALMHIDVNIQFF